jgi:hypothetical protein
VGRTDTIEYAEALGRLALRYFASRGPATANDFSIWSGLGLGECKKAIDIIAGQLQAVMIDGVKYFISKDAVLIEKIEPTLHLGPLHLESSIHLLPIYDEYIMGYKDRSAIFGCQGLSKTIPLLKYDCMIIFNGQAIGTWPHYHKMIQCTPLAATVQRFGRWGVHS